MTDSERNRGPTRLSESPHGGVRARRRQHDEAVRVLEQQISTVRSIDRRALRTVRISVLIVGLLVSATEVSTVPDPTGVPLVAGVLALVLTSVLGTLTYTVSFPVAGPGPAAIDDLLEGGYDESEWLAVLLGRYAEWLEANARTNYLNGALLAVTQLSLVAGVVSLGIGLLGWVV